MTAIDLRTEITRMLKDVKDTSVLEQVRAFVREHLKAKVEEVVLTADDIAVLDERRAEYLRGEGASYTMEESLDRLRSRKR
jgi:hypothetical protein